MNHAFINSYFNGGSLVFRDGYKINTMGPDLVGYLDSLTINNKIGAIEFLRNLIISIFVHDVTYIKINDLFLLFKYLGVQKSLTLIQSNSIKLVDDNGLDLGILEDNSKRKYIGFFENSYMYPGHKKAEHFNSSLEYLNFEISKSPLYANIKTALLYNIEKRTVSFNVDDTIERLKAELDYDLANSNTIQALGLPSNNIENISDTDFDGIFKLAKNNQGLLYSAVLKTDNLIFASNASDTIKIKFSELYKISRNESIDTFNYLTDKIGIPDFTDLILNDIISIETFINLREAKGAKKFRLWFQDIGYDKEAAIKEMFSQHQSLLQRNKVAPVLRWAFSNAIGLIGPFPGALYTAVDSFLLDKIFSGWNPNIYLNETLGKYLNRKAEKSRKEKEDEELVRRLGKIGRNDSCICGSGKKFKKCCGRSK